MFHTVDIYPSSGTYLFIFNIYPRRKSDIHIHTLSSNHMMVLYGTLSFLFHLTRATSPQGPAQYCTTRYGHPMLLIHINVPLS